MVIIEREALAPLLKQLLDKLPLASELVCSVCGGRCELRPTQRRAQAILFYDEHEACKHGGGYIEAQAEAAK